MTLAEELEKAKVPKETYLYYMSDFEAGQLFFDFMFDDKDFMIAYNMWKRKQEPKSS